MENQMDVNSSQQKHSQEDGILVKDIVSIVEVFAPPHLAMEGDRIGLQVGDMQQAVKKVWLALDPSPQVIEQAVQEGVNLLITHHALFYRSLHQINTATTSGKALATALANNLAIYSAHTNLDIAWGGVNDIIAEKVGLNDIEILDITYRDPLYKIVVYVPKTHQDVLFEALTKIGAGCIGNYSHCTFCMEGTGTFKPLLNAKPFLGQVGKIEHVKEVRIETVAPKSILPQVIAQMLAAHPYEEVAYDVYPIEQPGQAYGIGRVGHLAKPMSLHDFVKWVREVFRLPHIRYAGQPDTWVERVAVLGGSGHGWMTHSLQKGAQVLLTADCGHHDMLDAWNAGLAIVDATHAALEVPVLQRLCQEIQIGVQNRFPNKEIRIEESPIQADPFQWV